MPFDQTTRNRLASFVGDTRKLLTDEFTRQLQNDYGLDSATGEVAALESLGQLDDARRETAVLLRETLEHYLAGAGAAGVKARREALDRIVREQAFTVLNRLCALRLAEARGVLIESVGNGYQSKGFQLYSRLAGTALGERGDAYREYLFSIFDEFAVDLPVLFDRFSPEGRLFPREATLLAVLAEIDHPEIEPLWAEDETIGWIYQYFNSKEERKAMRDASSAPRNSRELAVRNQFFTPRYVVEFLTDNTLGRIWYEMTRGETALKEECRYLVRRPSEVFLEPGESAPEPPQQDDLSQEELLRQTVYVPHRPLKDPRDLKMLDPACGSMHFGLYAFDLFERIYEEAWKIEEAQGADALLRSEGMAPLHNTYADRDAFLRDVPRLIIERNVHGIDIDPRAVQIAGLSLWLRAQRSWQGRGVKPQQRPQIRRSNIVCAEPMPGEEGFIEEFVEAHLSDTPERKLLGQLFRRVVEAMKLAGDAGSLLKVEEEISVALAEARDRWLVALGEEQARLFFDGEAGLDVARISGDDFWDEVEERFYAALRTYAERAEYGSGIYQRRLFADDVAQGFAFIDLCRRRYDVVLMNPPFGLAPERAFEYLRDESPSTYVELYASFVTRAVSLAPDGRVGAITSRGFYTMTRLTDWRSQVFIPTVELVVDLGLDVMDAAFVGSAAYILEPAKPSPMILIRSVADDTSREDAITHPHWRTASAGIENGLFVRSRDHFRSLPAEKFIFKAGQELSALFCNCASLEGSGAVVRTGLTTFDDGRFLRLVWEAPSSHIGRGRQWEPFSKGGDYAKYYTDVYLVINRAGDGAELAEVNRQRNGQIAQSRQGSTYYYLPGLTFTSRSAKGLSIRALPAGCVISHNAPTIYASGNTNNAYLLGWINSRLIRMLAELQASADYFTPGSLKNLPWVNPGATTAERVRDLAISLTGEYRIPSTIDECSPAFQGFRSGESLRIAYQQWNSRLLELIESIRQHQREVSSMIDRLYGIRSSEAAADLFGQDVDGDDVPIECVDLVEWVSRAISYVFGVVMGRWVLADELVGFGATPDEYDPFSAVQMQSDLLLSFDLRQNEIATYAQSGIVVGDTGHTRDLEARVHDVLEVIWKHQWESIEREACEILGVRSLRDYFLKPGAFFADHLKRYSKSRRQAPIYWPLSTPSGSYTLWVYYHRLTDQTLYTCVNDFVEPRLKQVAEDATRLRAKSGRSSPEEKELEMLSNFEAELTEFRDELLRIAKFWKPNLNDGVQITAAPLWRLFQLKPWQKKLRETWEALEDGEYDWAHLAYSIWPERVRETCRTDKSLAIAHGLEDLYEAPPEQPKKKRSRKKVAEDELDELELDA